MPNPKPPVDKVEDPSPSQFWRLFLIVAVVLVLVGLVALIAGNLIVGGIITIMGAAFGVGGQVSKNKNLQL